MFACVNCEGNVSELYKKCGPTVLKLIQCTHCKKVADKYIEFDNVIILIDIILFKREPYLHILYNTEFRNYWRLAILLVLIKTYVEWMSITHVHENGQMRLEQTFFRCCLVTLLAITTYVLIIILILHFHQRFLASRLKPFDLEIVIKALVVSNFGQLLILPSIIWYDVHKQIHAGFVIVYCLLSQTQALSVVSSMSRGGLFILLAFAAIVEKLIIDSNLSKEFII